jgi:hypothetical protein
LWYVLPLKKIDALGFRVTNCNQNLQLKRRSTIILHGSTSLKTILNFKELIPVYTENHTQHINTKLKVTDSLNGWYM